jgi:hypothetical protein
MDNAADNNINVNNRSDDGVCIDRQLDFDDSDVAEAGGVEVSTYSTPTGGPAVAGHDVGGGHRAAWGVQWARPCTTWTWTCW